MAMPLSRNAGRPSQSAPRSPDLWILAAGLALLTIGTVAVASASAQHSLHKFGDASYYLRRHLIWLVFGAGAVFAGMRINYRALRHNTYWLLLAALVLAVLVLLIGPPRNDARRWIVLGPVSIQPTEIAKLALIVYLADSLGRKAEHIKSFTVGFVPHVLVCMVLMVLLLMQPDYGSAMILGITTFTMLFVAGARISYIATAVLAAAPVAYHFIVGTPWRLQRFLAFFNPEAYADGVAYQTIQARIALGSGGATGVGLGEGKQQLGYMIEGHNDFVMTCVGEELGFVGFSLVLALVCIIVFRGVLAATRSRDVFGSYLALGITLSFAVQAWINIGVVLGVLPNKGLTLPLVSYGGSSMIVSCFAIGLLLNVSSSHVQKRPARLPNGKPNTSKNRRRAVVICES